MRLLTKGRAIVREGRQQLYIATVLRVRPRCPSAYVFARQGTCRNDSPCCAGTMSRQYTIRSVPAEVDQALRRRAQREAKSLNAVAVEALARGLELAATTTVYTDLDGLIGSWQEDPAFDRAMVDFERIDEESWK